jgi:hypothetical protein
MDRYPNLSSQPYEFYVAYELTLLLIHSNKRSLALSNANSAPETISRAFPARPMEWRNPSAHELPRASFLLA